MILLPALLICLVRPAFGYLDPGTGSYVLQLLIGGIMGGLFALALFWRRVLAFARRLLSGHRKDRNTGT